MPIYEYQCSKCGHIQEVLQKVSERPLTKCAQCSGKMHKLISQSSFHLKGTGWYVTDYAKKSAKAKGVSQTKNDAAAKSGGVVELHHRHGPGRARYLRFPIPRYEDLLARHGT